MNSMARWVDWTSTHIGLEWPNMCSPLQNGVTFRCITVPGQTLHTCNLKLVHGAESALDTQAYCCWHERKRILVNVQAALGGTPRLHVLKSSPRSLVPSGIRRGLTSFNCPFSTLSSSHLTPIALHARPLPRSVHVSHSSAHHPHHCCAGTFLN